MHAVIETSAYLNDANAAGLSGTSGSRSWNCSPQIPRLACSCREPADIPVFLLGVIDKGERANLSKAEQNTLRKELAGIADDYRAGTRRAATRR
jgi:hypothetical protein